MNYEYKYVDQITEVTKTEEGMQGQMNTKKAEQILKIEASEGWRVHTVFTDPFATTLLERPKKKWYQIWK